MYDFLPGWMRQVKDLTAHALWTIYRRICFPCTTHLQVSNTPRFLFYQQKSLVFLGLSLYHSCPLIVFSLNFFSISLSGTVLANSVFLFDFWVMWNVLQPRSGSPQWNYSLLWHLKWTTTTFWWIFLSFFGQTYKQSCENFQLFFITFSFWILY